MCTKLVLNPQYRHAKEFWPSIGGGIYDLADPACLACEIVCQMSGRGKHETKRASAQG